jgi:hypothetical protein
LEAAALDHRDRLHLIQNNGVVTTVNSLADRVRTLEAIPQVVNLTLEGLTIEAHPKKEGRRPRKAPKTGR